MPEQIQAILNRILEWWRKFTKRQQVLIISITAVVIVSFAILAFIMTRPTMVQLTACDDGKQAAAVKELLESEKIPYETSEDGFTYYINEKDLSRANVLLGSNEIPSSGYTIDNVIDGSFSTTEADKQKRYKILLQEMFAKDIESFEMVEKARVTLNIPEDDGTLIARNQPGWSSVILTLSSPISDETVEGIAKLLATNLANETTDNITIMDTDGNLLYPNAQSGTAAGSASANQDARDKARAEIVKRVQTVLEGTNLYDAVSVGVNLSMNFDEN
ncbi:MAG: flagellar biosynthesis protein, partial [Pseudobutyrivibrio sp.]|nr:flagellar biosynthesis protein [Pseudobutyrivibrio sp.]